MKTYLHTCLLLFSFTAMARAQPLAMPSPAPSPTPSASRVVADQQQTKGQVEEIGAGDVLRISANLVSVPVSVVNREGQYVVDLRQRDFRVYEDGEEQTIVHFSNVDQPFSVVL